MSFLYPAFLFGALAIAVPVALHLLRRDAAPEVPFSAVRLLQRSPIARTRRRRLRDLLLLAARVAALSLLALAFARPYFVAGEAARLHVVAIDRSYSMGLPGRFTRAQDLARGAIAEAGTGDRVAVIAFDDRAEVLASPGSAVDARAAVAGLHPGFRTTRYGPALERAVELAGDSPARIVVISDLQRAGWDDAQPILLPPNVAVEKRDAGLAASNAAVTEVRVEPDRVVATITNDSPSTFAGTARISVDGRTVGSAAVRVPPEASVEAVVRYHAGDRGSLAVSIDDAAGFPADDVRYAVLDAAERVRVAIVTAGGTTQSGLYVARALEAAGERFQVDVSARAGELITAGEVSSSAVVLMSTRGVDRKMREDLASYVRRGGGVLIAAGPDMEPPVLSSVFGWPEPRTAPEAGALTLAASEVRHPIFRPFGAFAANLGQVRFGRIWTVDENGWETAARFADGSAALLERTEGKGRALLFASDLDRRWNDFPLHAAFVPFIAEVVLHAANTRDTGRDYLVSDAPPGAGPAPGVYTTTSGQVVAVNVDTRESSTVALAAGEFDAMFARAPAGPAEGQQRAVQRAQVLEAERGLWQYGLVLMLGVLVLESVVGRS